MLSNEEKKAWERIVRLIIYFEDWDAKVTIVSEDIKYFKTILNLIEKQSKEIEELKEKNKRLEKFIENGEYTWKQKYNETFDYVKEELEKEKEKNKEYEILLKRQEELDKEKENLIKQGWLNE